MASRFGRNPEATKMIDTHCHVDLFTDPVETARMLDRELSMCVAVTMLPSHFEMGHRHLSVFHRVVCALGLHPLRAHEGRGEIQRFIDLAETVKFIGEIGLDGSAEGKASLGLQKELFVQAIRSIRPGAFVTVHSRGAWRETLELLRTNRVGPVCFHYFTGGANGAEAILAEGHFLSINQRMIKLGSRHRLLASELPRDRVLIETDAPFLGKSDPVKQLEAVYSFFSEAWQSDPLHVRNLVRENFTRCRTH